MCIAYTHSVPTILHHCIDRPATGFGWSKNRCMHRKGDVDHLPETEPTPTMDHRTTELSDGTKTSANGTKEPIDCGNHKTTS
jgi:hypothetical protein